VPLPAEGRSAARGDERGILPPPAHPLGSNPAESANPAGPVAADDGRSAPELLDRDGRSRPRPAAAGVEVERELAPHAIGPASFCGPRRPPTCLRELPRHGPARRSAGFSRREVHYEEGFALLLKKLADQPWFSTPSSMLTTRTATDIANRLRMVCDLLGISGRRV
jgi:hypothetical protein